jgi:ribosomal protein S18 acetylase RimI-like enzyme
MGSPDPAFAPGLPARLSLRCEPCLADRDKVAGLVAATGFFTPDEIAVAVELVEERLQQGKASGYEFVFAEQGAQLSGYTCFGPIPCTHGSYELYWIAVQPGCQRTGIGRMLIAHSERLMKEAGGRRVYIDTSSRFQYASTRAFYERCGYRQEALLEDFYAPGDGKVIYGKVL